MFQVVDERILWNGECVAFLTVPEGVLRAVVVDALHEYDPDAAPAGELEAMEQRLDDLRDKIRECIE